MLSGYSLLIFARPLQCIEVVQIFAQKFVLFALKQCFLTFLAQWTSLRITNMSRTHLWKRLIRHYLLENSLFYFLIILIFLLQKFKKFGEINNFNVKAAAFAWLTNNTHTMFNIELISMFCFYYDKCGKSRFAKIYCSKRNNGCHSSFSKQWIGFS